MGVVTYFVGTADGYLNDAAETQFGALAATVGTLGTVACSLVVLLVFVNMVFQYRAMEGRQAFWLCVKMVLIGFFAQSWSHFDLFASAVLHGVDSIAGAIVSSVGGGEPGPSGTFAEAHACASRTKGRTNIERASHGYRRKSWFRTGLDVLRHWILAAPRAAANLWRDIWLQAKYRSFRPRVV